MAELLVKWTKVIINSNKNDITTCPQIDNIQVDLGDIQDLNFCTHMPQIKAVWGDEYFIKFRVKNKQFILIHKPGVALS